MGERGCTIVMIALTNNVSLATNHDTYKKNQLASLFTKMWNILAVIPWAVAFRRNVTEDSVDDWGDIGLTKWGVVRFLCIVFTIWIATRISCTCTMTLCTGCTGTGISSLRGSPGGRGHLFSGTARGTSAYTTRQLLATRRLGGNWRHQVNSHVPLSGLFPRSWHIARLLPNKKIHYCSHRLNSPHLFPTESTH